MGFWVFMLICDILLPLSLIVLGAAYMKGRYPKTINDFSGYRTERSRKNQDTWNFAQKLFGKVSFMFGCVILPLSVLPNLFVLGCETDICGLVGGMVAAVQIFVFIIIYPIVESGIRKEFK